MGGGPMTAAPLDAVAPADIAPTAPDRGRFAPMALAAALALLAVAMGWRGMDLPAQIYRVGLFHRQGMVLWDTQWYGGHWTLNYSVIFPPVAGVLGMQVTEVLAAAAAAWAFDRVVVGHFGRSARVGSLLFAAGTFVQVVIGQLPFLLGESLALGAWWAASRRRWPLAVLLALGAALASPLAAAFLVLALVPWLVSAWPRLRTPLLCMMAAAALPSVATIVLFPGEGAMPFPWYKFAKVTALLIAALVVIPRREGALRAGVALYLLATVVSFVVPTPLGTNISRLSEVVGAPLACCVLWPRRRTLLVSALIPFGLLQWTPALATFSTPKHELASDASYFTNVLAFLHANDTPAGRVEIVPTKLHWEVAYAAPTIALARGWERQLDTVDNPIFYKNDALTPASYRAWLLDAGVRYVALPDVPLDYAGEAEGRLVADGVPGLTPVWHDAHWRVFSVAGADGIVTGPATVRQIDGGSVRLDATGPGRVVLRVRYSKSWRVVEGAACVAEGPGTWTTLDVTQPGPVQLALRLVGSGPGTAC